MRPIPMLSRKSSRKLNIYSGHSVCRLIIVFGNIYHGRSRSHLTKLRAPLLCRSNRPPITTPDSTTCIYSLCLAISYFLDEGANPELDLRSDTSPWKHAINLAVISPVAHDKITYVPRAAAEGPSLYKTMGPEYTQNPCWSIKAL